MHKEYNTLHFDLAQFFLLSLYCVLIQTVLFPQGRITGLTGIMDFMDNGSNSHVQFEILGTSFSETFGKDIKRVSSIVQANF